MKITNLSKRGLNIGERSLSPGQTVRLDDEKLTSVQHLLDEGLISVEKVKITEKKKLKEGEYG